MKPHVSRHSASQGLWTRADRPVTTEELAWLRTTQGQAVCREMAETHPADTPAAITHWRERLEPDRIAASWNQVRLRRAARAKFSRAEQMLFDRVGLEQASDEVVAAHKARRFAGSSRVADLCCGIGGDAIALAAVTEVVAVDAAPARVVMAQHNSEVYARHVHGLVADVLFHRPEADAMHIDPDRRGDGRRRHNPADSSPPLPVITQLVSHYRHAAVKLSPGSEFAALPFEAEIELISHHGVCRQAVVWTGRFKQCLRRATVLPAGNHIEANAESEWSWPEPEAITPGSFLFEPDAAVIRADLVGVLARRFELRPIDPQIAYLVGPSMVDTPLLSGFRVIEAMPWSVPVGRALLARHEIGRIEVKTRGFAGRPEDIAKRLRPRGHGNATLFLTRIGTRPVAVLADRLNVRSAAP